MSFDEDEGLLAKEMKLAQNAKKIALMILGTAGQKYMLELSDQQEVLINAADIIIDAYQMESAILRAQKYAEKEGEESAAAQIDMAGVFLQRRDSARRNEGEKHACRHRRRRRNADASRRSKAFYKKQFADQHHRRPTKNRR